MIGTVLMLLVGLVVGGVPAAHADDCGAGGRCHVEGGYYLAELPEGWNGQDSVGLVVHFHGWANSAEVTMGFRPLVDGVTRRGAIFVPVEGRNGTWRQMGAGRADWGRDEHAFIHAVMADIRARWPIDGRLTLASGFSRGGSMAWNVACFAGDLFQAYLPIAGGFWHSTPGDCPTGPVTLRHIHGLADGVVAYDTVGIYNSMPVPDGFALLRRINGTEGAADARIETASFACEIWRAAANGHELHLCTHPGGHSIRAEWIGEAYQWLVDRQADGGQAAGAP